MGPEPGISEWGRNPGNLLLAGAGLLRFFEHESVRASVLERREGGG